MDKNLSQIVAELFARSTGSEDLSSRIHRIHGEIKKVIESEEAVYGKFRGLLESLREVIPDEKQRYNAALKALFTTSKLSRQEIIKAISGQIEELKILEKGLLPAQQGWRDELKAMEARSRELKNEVSKLREKLAQLESEEKAILTGMAAREKELEGAEKTVRELFASIGAEIAALQKKVEELTAESPAAQPGPSAAQRVAPKAPVESPAAQPSPSASQPTPPKAPVKSDAPSEKKEGGEKKIVIQTASPAEETKWQKKCPMCGGPLNLLELENMWQCYTCAYEEPTTGEGQVAGGTMNAPTCSPASSLDESSASFSDDDEGSKKGSSSFDTHTATKKKTCPACRKKMFWYPKEKAWRCPNCQYERRI